MFFIQMQKIFCIFLEGLNPFESGMFLFVWRLTESLLETGLNPFGSGMFFIFHIMIGLLLLFMS